MTDFERPIGDRADRKRKVANLTVGLGLLLRSENAGGDRAGGRQRTQLLPQLRQRNVMVVRARAEQHMLLDAVGDIVRLQGLRCAQRL